MRKYFKFISFVFAAILILAACKKNNLVVDKTPIVTPPAAAEFLLTNFTRSYYVAASGTTGFNLPVGVTNVSSEDRTIQLSYVSSTGATLGTHFNAPTSITIKGGQATANLNVQGVYSYYATGRIDSVKVKITSGSIAAFKGKDSVVLVMQRYCDVILADLSGDYANTNEYNTAGAFSYGPYTASLNNLVSTSATTATGSLVNLYDDGWNDITCTIDWTDPANFNVTIPLQPTGKAYGSATATSVRTSATKASSFSSCSQEFQIFIDLVDATTGVASTSGYKFYLKR